MIKWYNYASFTHNLPMFHFADGFDNLFTQYIRNGGIFTRSLGRIYINESLNFINYVDIREFQFTS